MELIFFLFAVDPHFKVFQDFKPPDQIQLTVAMACARNEYEPAQVVLHPRKDLKTATIRVDPFRHQETGRPLGDDTVRWNFVGYLPLPRNTPNTPESRLVRKAPCEVPDVLLPDRTRSVKAGSSQPVWLTVRVPSDAPPGKYLGKVFVETDLGNGSLPVELLVWPFSLPGERHLFVTNWFNTSAIARAHKVEEWSEPFWMLLERYFLNMAEHRQNVAWVSWRLIGITRDAGGELSFDFSRFDRYVELMERCRVADRIEIQHVAHFGEGGWTSPSIEFRSMDARDASTGKTVRLGFEDGLKPLLSALETHLEKRGWLERSLIHIADEPSRWNLDSWRARSRQVHEAAPRLRRIDAIEASEFTGDLEVWVPKLSHLNHWFPWFHRAQEQGAELWYYICCHPHGGLYPNRFLDFPLIDVRLLHWIHATYGLQGYLHWGLNFWRGDPFGPPAENLPPGDTHAIYPGPEGPLNSLRWEIQRESLEDFEYLWLLTSKLKEVQKRLGKPARDLEPGQRSRELAGRLVRGFADLVRDPKLLLETRAQIAREILECGSELPVLINTRPPETSELVSGPISVEIIGVTLPEAKVTVNRTAVSVSPDGRFALSLGMSPRLPQVKIEVSRGGITRTMERRFTVRGEG